jgi:nucleotide-binding universal stress UspA family protein
MKAKKIKKVLIALDYNPSAQQVAEAGFSIAETMKVEVTLLHVLTDPVYYSSTEYSPIMGLSGHLETGSLQMDSIEGLIKASQHFLDKLKNHLGDKSIQTMVKEGNVAESILETAGQLHADVIVMGSHSRRWLDEILMGSVTEKVLHQTSVPLFIIPTKKRN